MGIRAQYFGQPYPDTPRYYWVDVRFPCCDGPVLGPAAVMTAENLDSNNVVLVQWDPEPGATSYTLLCTDEATMPAPGDQCVVAKGGGTSYSDNGGSLSAYPEALKIERPKAGKTFEVTIAKPSPRPDRRQTDPEVAKAKEDAKKAADEAKKADQAKSDFKAGQHETTHKK